MAILDFVLDPVNLRRDVRRILVECLAGFLKPGAQVYDIGCGARPFKGPVEALGAIYTGVDLADGFYDASLVDMIGSAYEVPVPDESADAAISCQVMEHLERPQDALAEVRRILKPGGILFLSFPFLYPLHAVPRDFFRYTEFGMDRLLTDSGFEILMHKRIGGFWYALAVWMGIYLQSFDRGVLQKIRLIRGVCLLLDGLCLGFHKFEGLALETFKKDTALVRRNWTVNYVMVVRKK